MLGTICCDISSTCVDCGYNLSNNVDVAAAGSSNFELPSSEVLAVVGLSEVVCESGAGEVGF